MQLCLLHAILTKYCVKEMVHEGNSSKPIFIGVSLLWRGGLMSSCNVLDHNFRPFKNRVGS